MYDILLTLKRCVVMLAGLSLVPGQPRASCPSLLALCLKTWLSGVRCSQAIALAGLCK